MQQYEAYQNPATNRRVPPSITLMLHPSAETFQKLLCKPVPVATDQWKVKLHHFGGTINISNTAQFSRWQQFKPRLALHWDRTIPYAPAPFSQCLLWASAGIIVWNHALHRCLEEQGEVLVEACTQAVTDLINTACYGDDCGNKCFGYNLIMNFFHWYQDKRMLCAASGF